MKLTSSNLVGSWKYMYKIGGAVTLLKRWRKATILLRAWGRKLQQIRHVPYTTPDGIIGTHAYFIKRAAAEIFVTGVTNCEPRVKVLAARKPLMVLTWNIPVLQEYSEPTLESPFNIVSLKR